MIVDLPALLGPTRKFVSVKLIRKSRSALKFLKRTDVMRAELAFGGIEFTLGNDPILIPCLQKGKKPNLPRAGSPYLRELNQSWDLGGGWPTLVPPNTEGAPGLAAETWDTTKLTSLAPS